MDAVGRALALDPSTAAIRLTASDVVSAVARFGRAKREFEQAVRLAPNDPAILSRLAFRDKTNVSNNCVAHGCSTRERPPLPTGFMSH